MTDSADQRSKKTAEKVKSNASNAIGKEFFKGSSDRDLIPRRAPSAGSAEDRYGRRKAQPKSIEDSQLTAPTIPTAPSAAKQGAPPGARDSEVPGTRSKQTQVRREENRRPLAAVARARTSSNYGTRIVLIFVLAGILFYLFAPSTLKTSSDLNQAKKTRLESEKKDSLSAIDRERVNFHREAVGRKLNRDRMGVQYQNVLSSTVINLEPKYKAEHDMMTGLPLAGERPTERERSRDSRGSLSPTFADTYVQYSLKEQQEAADLEKRLQKQYIDEFIANAARAGYRVKVDKNGNVKVEGRNPAANGTELSSPASGTEDPGRSGGGAIH